jgi:hypothetical protein
MDKLRQQLQFYQDNREDINETLATSPCGRYQKQNKRVHQPHQIPGVSNTYMVMDSEEGTEVTWGEIRISEPNLKDNLINEIRMKQRSAGEYSIRIHNYWIQELKNELVLVVITDYMPFGSLEAYLKVTARMNKTKCVQWKSWCRQILLCLDTRFPTLDPRSVYIHQDGTLKIGYGTGAPASVAMFGQLALQLATLQAAAIPEQQIAERLATVADDAQRDFICTCLHRNPSIAKLLAHPALQ